MKKVILASLFCFIAFGNVYSQSKKESIKELLHLLKTDSVMFKTFKSLLPVMQSQIQGQVKDSASKARSVEIMLLINKTAKEMSNRVNDDEVIALYDKYYTQNEINDYISFYKSPSGQKFITANPDLQKEINTLINQKYIPDIQKTIKQKLSK